jgi:Zn-dependent M32 family carboxypeptidase
VKQQRFLARRVARVLGLDLTRTRIDVAAHSFFVQLGPDDFRIALNLRPSDLVSGLTVFAHEAGHALYEQGLDRAAFGLHPSSRRICTWHCGSSWNPDMVRIVVGVDARAHPPTRELGAECRHRRQSDRWNA